MSKEPEIITVEEFDRIFDERKEDITQYFAWSQARRPGMEPFDVSVDPFYSDSNMAAIDEATKQIMEEGSLCCYHLAE